MIKKEKSSSINKNLKTIPRHHKDQLDEIIFRDTLENINLIAVALDLEGNINFCNEYLLKLTGWKKEEIIGKNWFEYFLSANVKDEVLKMFKEAINSGNLPLHYINEIITKSGETRIINWNNTCLLYTSDA
ncbi:MAG: PAS domain S-box protein, partial [Ignavibacteria bacterium]|nr:PAS domain S-box protein [Ignavibacteria bacterium]